MNWELGAVLDTLRGFLDLFKGRSLLLWGSGRVAAAVPRRLEPGFGSDENQTGLINDGLGPPGSSEETDG